MRRALCFLLLVALEWPAAAQILKPQPPVAGKTVAPALAPMGQASTFCKERKAAKLDSVLNGPPKLPYMVFVPSNEAFARLEERGLSLASSTGRGPDQHQTEQLLRLHIVCGCCPTEALKPGMILPSLNAAFPVKVRGYSWAPPPHPWSWPMPTSCAFFG